jgi:GNAT superfamily N-acetyltransferase
MERETRISLVEATEDDVADLVALRTAVAEKLTADHGPGPWSGVSSDPGVRFDLRNSSLFVARRRGRLIATFRLATKKPWAIDPDYFTAARRALYLLSMAVAPDLQRQDIGRGCVEEMKSIARKWPADVIRLDAYDAAAGAGPFYEKCGFQNRGRASFRGCPLIYFEMLL